MIVIALTDTPPKVRGDLSKWLLEINTGVYVGNVSARVREELWERICKNLKTGRATMVYSSSGEQKMEFRVHNSSWVPVDFDGLKLMLHPTRREDAVSDEEISKRSLKKAYRMLRHNKGGYPIKEKRRAEETGEEKEDRQEGEKERQGRKEKQEKQLEGQIDKEYVVIDLETTGLLPQKDDIIEIAAIYVKEGLIIDEFNVLVYTEQPLSEEISHLTGITNDMLEDEGLYPKEALAAFEKYIRDKTVVGHNISFDFAFLDKVCKEQGMEMFSPKKVVDTLSLARKRIQNISDYKLTTLAQCFGLDTANAHSALGDCYLTNMVYRKLKEMEE